MLKRDSRTLVAAAAASLALIGHGERVEVKLYQPVRPCVFADGYCAEPMVPYLAEGRNLAPRSTGSAIPLSILDAKYAVTTTSTSAEPATDTIRAIIAHSIIR